MVRSTNPTPATVERLVITQDATTPLIAPLKITPTAAPAYHEAGDVYVNSTTGNLLVSDGTVLFQPGGKRQIIHAATTLTKAHSGALCVWDTAAGFLYTLPAAEEGLWFDFLVGVTITSSASKVITAAGDFLLGNFIQSADGTYTSASHAADGTTIVSWNGNGSTTGGLIGDWLRVHAVSATQWWVYGMGRATGTESTPFANS